MSCGYVYSTPVLTICNTHQVVNSMTCIIYNYYVKLYLNTDIVGYLFVIKFVVISTISDKHVPRISSNKRLQYSVHLRCSAHYL